MIIYQGIKNRNKLTALCFSNDAGSEIEIPIDEATATRISLYLTSFDKASSIKNVERGNEGPIDE